MIQFQTKPCNTWFPKSHKKINKEKFVINKTLTVISNTLPLTLQTAPSDEEAEVTKCVKSNNALLMM